jgi:hypothetical protein
MNISPSISSPDSSGSLVTVETSKLDPAVFAGKEFGLTRPLITEHTDIDISSVVNDCSALSDAKLTGLLTAFSVTIVSDEATLERARKLFVKQFFAFLIAIIAKAGKLGVSVEELCGAKHANTALVNYRTNVVKYEANLLFMQLIRYWGNNINRRTRKHNENMFGPPC